MEMISNLMNEAIPTLYSGLVKRTRAFIPKEKERERECIVPDREIDLATRGRVEASTS